MESPVKFRPMQDYILVKPVERKKSEILQVVTHTEDRGSDGAIAIVAAVGPGKHDKHGRIVPLAVNVGDEVMFGGAGLGGIQFPEYLENKDRYLIIQEADIVGINKQG